MQCSARFLGQQVGVMLGLLLPDAAELVIDVAALRIEIIALAVAIQPHALLVAPVEELAERVGARLRHRLVERLGAAGDLAVLTVLLAALGLAVREKAAPLVEEERSEAHTSEIQSLMRTPSDVSLLET